MTPFRDPLAAPPIPLVVAACFALVWGLRAGSADALALSTALTALLVGAFAWSRAGARSVRARRELAPRAYEDERIEVRFSVEGTGALPLVGLEVADVFPADRAPEKRAVVFPALPPRSRVTARYHADCDARRGAYVVGPVSIIAQDPLGLFRARETLDGTARLLVYPRVLSLPRVPLAAGGVRFDAGIAIGGQPGAGIEFLGTREYRPGDPLRAIHWKSTARLGVPIVTEWEETAAADTAIFLDLSRLSLRGMGRVSTLDISIRIAASVAAHAGRAPNRVRLHARGARPLDIPAGSGDHHLARVLETLALVKADGETPFTTVLRETAPLLSRGSTAVAIFAAPEPDLGVYADVLALYRARGVHLLAVLLDAATFVKIFDEQVAIERAAHGLVAEAAALAAHGAAVVTVARGDDIAKRFERWMTLEAGGVDALLEEERAEEAALEAGRAARRGAAPVPETRKHRRGS